MKSWLIPVAILSTLSVAACGDATENGGAATVQRQPEGGATVQIQVPESLVPAAEAIANPQATIDAMRGQAGTMSEQMKQDAVIAARRAAENGARALGQTDAQITQTGDVAERSARDALGMP
jgi:hypothetical protein